MAPALLRQILRATAAAHWRAPPPRPLAQSVRALSSGPAGRDGGGKRGGLSDARAGACPRCHRALVPRAGGGPLMQCPQCSRIVAPPLADATLGPGIHYVGRINARRRPADESQSAGDALSSGLFLVEEPEDAVVLSGEEEAHSEGDAAPVQPPRPREIVAHLDQHVVGQTHAKRVLSVAMYNHYCRLAEGARDSDVQCDKSNVMLIGPSGTGKTLLTQHVAALLRVPYAVCDATTLTEAGYVGEDVDVVLRRLLEAAEGNVARAQRGIIFMDEVDKLSRRKVRAQGTRDVGGEGVQQALLKMMEGTVVSVERSGGGRGGLMGLVPAKVAFDTSKLLFVFSGAFSGLDQIVRERLDRRSLGFEGAAAAGARLSGSFSGAAPGGALGDGARPRQLQSARDSTLVQIGNDSHDAAGAGPRDWTQDATTTDLIAYGLIPEFVGRVPIIAALGALDEAALVRTLTEPRNSLVRQYTALLAQQGRGTRLEFTPAALRAIAAQAVREGTGARGLRSIMERVLLPVMYDAPDAEYAAVTIDADTVEHGAPARCEPRKAAA